MNNTVIEYMFATKISENQYEAFQTLGLDISYDTQKRIDERISAALSGGSLSSVNATGYNNVAIGSTWNGTEFILPEIMHQDWSFDEGIPEINIMGVKNNVFVFLNNNVVFLTMSNPEGSIDAEKFTAAFTNDVILVKLNADQIVPYGSIWDGSTWTLPTQ